MKKFYNIGSTSFSSLISSNLIANYNYYKNIKTRKPDAIILNNNNEILCIIEFKKPSELDSEKKRERERE